MKRLILPLIFLPFLALGPSPAPATELPFEIPPAPWPPMILSVANSSASINHPVTITVTVRGDLQLVWDADAGDNGEFVEAPPGDVGGHNPTLISKVTVYYTKDPLMEGFVNSVPLTCVAGCDDDEASTWQGQIPASVHTGTGTVYYIVSVVDTFGNMAVEDPDPTQGPVTHDNPSAGDWGVDIPSPFQAPFINNGLTGCASGSTYALCDQLGDAEGFGGIAIPEVDIRGINLGVDASSLYLAMDLNATSIPKPGGYIEAYSFAFFNPDAQDPDPYDYFFYKSYALLYIPELTTLPEMIESLWDGECLTDPNTPDVFACRITTCGIGTDCVRETVGGKLYFSVKHSNGSNKLFGSASEANTYTKILSASAQVDLNSADIFALSDMTRGASYYKRRHSYTIHIDPLPPDAVILTGATAADHVNYDLCSLTWLQAPEPDADGYFVYRALSRTASADQITKLNSTILPVGTTSFTDPTHLTQDGQTYWYFVSARNTANMIITPSGVHEADCAGSGCPISSRWNEIQNNARGCPTTIVECFNIPVITEVNTKPGKTGQLTVYFTAGDPNDPTLDRFMVYRDGIPISPNPIYWVGDQTYQATEENLANGTQYCYTVKLFDKSDYICGPSFEVCGEPRDREPPAMVRGLSGGARPRDDISQVKARLTWEADTEEDFAAYHIWECEATDPATKAPCESSGAPVPAAYADIAAINDIDAISYERGGFTPEDSGKFFCYVITAHDVNDNPENPSLYFPVMSYSPQYPFGSPCVLIQTTCCGTGPGGTTANAYFNDDGSAIEVSWDKIMANDDGTPFACAPNCISAGDWLGDELTSYVITAVEQGVNMPSDLETADSAFYPYICAIVPGPNIEQAECKTFLDNTTLNPHAVEIDKTYTVCVWGRDASDNISPEDQTTCVTLAGIVRAPDPPQPADADVTAVKDMGYIYFGFNKSPSETSVYKPLYKVYRCIDSQANDCSNTSTATIVDVTPADWITNADVWRVSSPEPGDVDYLTGYTSYFYFKEDVSALPDHTTSIYYYYLKAVNPYHSEYISDYSGAMVTDLSLDPPTNLIAYTEDARNVILNWPLSAECESPTSCPALSGYKLYHCGNLVCADDGDFSLVATITPATLAAYTLSSEAVGEWYYKLTSLGADGVTESALAKSVKTSYPVTILPELCADPTGQKCILGTITSNPVNINMPHDIKVYNEAGTALLKTGEMQIDGTFLIDLNDVPGVSAGQTVKIKLVLIPGDNIMHLVGATELDLGNVTIAANAFTTFNAGIGVAPPEYCFLFGDFNYNYENCCTINGLDFMSLRDQYNKPCADPDNCPTDFNKDGKTDGQDFAVFKRVYNFTSCYY